jgi:hypothetical protein
MAKFECPFCDSAFSSLITTESELRQHVLIVHGRVLDFNAQTVKVPEASTEG